jgi:hypothetical protein
MLDPVCDGFRRDDLKIEESALGQTIASARENGQGVSRPRYLPQVGMDDKSKKMSIFFAGSRQECSEGS